MLALAYWWNDIKHHMQFKNLLYFCNKVHFHLFGIASGFKDRQFSHCNREESFLDDRSLTLSHKAYISASFFICNSLYYLSLKF